MKLKLVLTLLAILVLGCSKEESKVRPLFELVPENASVAIKINKLSDLKRALQDNDFLNDLSELDTYRSVLDKIRFLSFVESEGVLSIVPTDEGRYEYIYATDEWPYIFDIDSVSNKKMEEISYEGFDLDKYELGSDIFYSLKIGDKIVLGSSPELLKNLVENLDKNEVAKPFQKLYEISNDLKSATLFIDPKKTDPIVLSLMKEGSAMRVSNFSDWMSLDLNIKPNQLKLQGVSIANDSLWSYVDLFANTKPLVSITPSIAPDGAEAIISYAFDSYKIFAINQQGFLGGTDVKNDLFDAVEEIGIVHLDTQKVIIMNTHGSQSIADYFENTKKSSIEYQGNQIVRLGDSDLLTKVFNPLIKNFKANFCTIIKNAFVFSETKENLELVIRNQKGGATFDKTETYLTLKKSLAEEANLLFISNSSSLKNLLKEDFSDDFNKELVKSLRSNYATAAQTIADKNLYHTNIVVEKVTSEVAENSITEVFNVSLDAEIASNPQFVVNHVTKKMDVVVQDQKNVLYLISASGKILWKKQLNGMVQGKIYQVDIFKNGRLQLAFTTNDQFLVLDRNGREVKQFIKTFDGGNLNPLAVFDYDGKKDYRFVITQSEKTFMYNSKAKIVDGFTYTKAEKPIIAAPKHIRMSERDFLVFKLEDGSLKILNRLGKVRTKVDEKIDFSENGVFLNKDKFTVTDKKGTLYQINGNGKITKTNFNLSPDHGMYATENTLVLMNDNTLTIKGKQVELELGVYTSPKIFYLNNKIYVSVTDLQQQKVYLFDSQAKPITNFPVFGNSMIDLNDIDNDRKLELVVKGEDDTILSYKLN